MKETLLTNIDLLKKIRLEKKLSNKYEKLFSVFLKDKVSEEEKKEDEIRLVQFLTDNLAQAKDVVDNIEAIDFNIFDKIKKHFLLLRNIIQNSTKIIHSDKLLKKLKKVEEEFDKKLEASLKKMDGSILASIKDNEIYFEHFTFERGNLRKLYRESKKLNQEEESLIKSGQEIQAVENYFKLKKWGEEVTISQEDFEKSLENYINSFEEYLKSFYEFEIRKFYLDIEELRKILKILLLLEIINKKIGKDPRFEKLKEAYEKVADKIKKWKLVNYEKIKDLEQSEGTIEQDFNESISKLKERKGYYKKLDKSYFFDTRKTGFHCTETVMLTAYSMLCLWKKKKVDPMKALLVMGVHTALGTSSYGGRDFDEYAVARDLGMELKEIPLSSIPKKSPG